MATKYCQGCNTYRAYNGEEWPWRYNKKGYKTHQRCPVCVERQKKYKEEKDAVS